MLRWLIVIFLTLILVNGFSSFLRRWGLGRLPGDFEFRFFGRTVFLPFASSVLLSVVAMLLVKYL